MRKLWSLALALLAALASVLIGVGPASAFGSETLGCSVGAGSWASPNCVGRDSNAIHFSVHNLSGTYSYAWTVTSPEGTTLAVPCGGTRSYDCISSGCTATTSTCNVLGSIGAMTYRVYAASLVLTQSGQSRTLSSQALLPKGCGTPTCI